MKRPAKWTAAVSLVAIALLGCIDSDIPITAPGDGESATTNPAPRPEQNPGLTMLPIRALQQTTSYTCGPAAIASLLHYYDRTGIRVGEHVWNAPGITNKLDLSVRKRYVIA